MNSTNRTIEKQFYTLLLSLSLVLAPIAGADAERVFAQVSPSVVAISILVPDVDDEPIVIGSGVVVGEGIVVTNCHVIEEEGYEIEAVFVVQAADSQGAEGYKIEADVIAKDKNNDVCLLFAGALTEPPAAPVVKLGAAKMLVRGEEVYAIGTPRGLKLSLSRGIVTQLRGIKGNPPIVQTDATILGGSSGGGLFNKKGELVGIVTFGFEGDVDNLNFAMPVEMASALIESVRYQAEEKKEQDICVEAPQYQCILIFARQVARQIDDVSERASVLEGIAVAQAQTGNFDDAIITAENIPFDESNYSDLEEYFDDYSNINHVSDLLGYVAVEQAQGGDFSKAKITAQQIEDPEYRDWISGQIAIAQAKNSNSGDSDIIEQHADDAEEHTLNFEGAKETAQQIGDAYERASVLSKIAIAQGEVKDFDDGRMTFYGALRAAQQVDDAFDRASALTELAMEQAEIGYVNGAIITIKEALDASQQIKKPFHRAGLLRDIAIAQEKAGDFDGVKTTIGEALRWTQQIKNTFFRVSALSEIAILQAQTGDIDEAKATVKEIRGTSYHAPVISEIAILQAQAGDIDGAKVTAQQVRGTSYHASVIGEIAILQAQAGELDGAQVTARQINDDFYYTQALYNIAVTQAEAGDFRGAMQTAQSINHEAAKAQALLNIAEALAQQ